MLGLTAVPDIEDMTEALDGTLDNPSPELLAELLGVSVDLVTGAVWDEWNPTLECLAGALGVSVEKGCKLFDWHNRAAARSAERIKTRAIIRIAGFFSIERIRGRQALGFCFCGWSLASVWARKHTGLRGQYRGVAGVYMQESKVQG